MTNEFGHGAESVDGVWSPWQSGFASHKSRSGQPFGFAAKVASRSTLCFLRVAC